MSPATMARHPDVKSESGSRKPVAPSAAKIELSGKASTGDGGFQALLHRSTRIGRKIRTLIVPLARVVFLRSLRLIAGLEFRGWTDGGKSAPGLL